jgi:hypothetical protein
MEIRAHVRWWSEPKVELGLGCLSCRASMGNKGPYEVVEPNVVSVFATLVQCKAAGFIGIRPHTRKSASTCRIFP